MRSARVDFGFVASALVIAITAFTARPALAEVTDVTIDYIHVSDPSGTDPIEVEVGFTWSHDTIETGNETYEADVYIDALDPDDPQVTVVLDGSDSPESAVATFNLPSSTPLGCYELTVEVIEFVGGVGASVKADTEVFCIEDPPSETPAGVPVDIKPGSCPNPIETGKGGVIPVAIVGTADLPVSEIDPHSVRLMGVKPTRFSYEDVATPYYPAIDGGEIDCMDCTTARGDGLTDLTLKFDAQDVVEAIRETYGVGGGQLEDRACLVLFLEGARNDTTPILGADIVRIQGKAKGSKGGAAKTKKK